MVTNRFPWNSPVLLCGGRFCVRSLCVSVSNVLSPGNSAKYMYKIVSIPEKFIKHRIYSFAGGRYLQPIDVCTAYSNPRKKFTPLTMTVGL